MAKFNEHERKIIRERLVTEGKKLFSIHGIRKVTINDLTSAVDIAHGSFYTFFRSKEHLFMEINLKNQLKIFNQLENLIDENKKLKSRKLVKIVICFLMDKFFADPIISSINSELWGYLSRRLPPEIIEKNNINDALIVEKLKDVGVKFNVHTSLIVKGVQALFMISTTFTSQDGESKEAINILLDGLIEKIVEE